MTFSEGLHLLELIEQRLAVEQERLAETAELLALAALVQYDAMLSAGEMQRYGEFQHDPRSEAAGALAARLRARRVLPGDPETGGTP